MHDLQEAPVDVVPADTEAETKEHHVQQTQRQPNEKVSFRMIIRNFTPS